MTSRNPLFGIPLVTGLLCLLVGLAAPLAVSAAELVTRPKAVVELFTSQGCSSCPKADLLLSEMAGRRDVVALAWHVDYWDYIGWPDTFGAPENTARQRGYAQSFGNRLFTPQLVVNGMDDHIGSHRDDVLKSIGASALNVAVDLDVSESMLHVRIPAAPGGGDAVVWLVSFIDAADVAIERGENAGQTVSYNRIVVGRQALGMWSGGEGIELKLPLSEVLTGQANGAAILLQREHQGLPGPILGAAAFTR